MSIRLTWDDINPGEDGFRVYRSTATMDPQALPAELVTLPANSVDFVDDTVSPNTEYFYRVSIYKGSLEVVSDEVSVSTEGDAAVTYDWSTYANNTEPTGFSRIWGTEDVWRVRQSSSELDADPTTSTGSALVAGNYTDVDITGLVRADSQQVSSNGSSHCGLVVRATGSARNGYIACLNGSTGKAHLFELFKYQSGGYTQLSTVSFNWIVGSDYNIRLRAVGTTIQAKIWADGDAEPTSWDISVTDTDHAWGAVGPAYFFAADYSWGSITVEDLS